MKYSYKYYGQGIYRPAIPIEIKTKKISLKYEVLIDSGADECIFDAQLADILKIDILKGEKNRVGGITGDIQVYYKCPVIISVGGWEYEIRVGFMPDMPEYGYGVLGQKGFFENFIVRFDYSKAEIELKPKVRNNYSIV